MKKQSRIKSVLFGIYSFLLCFIAVAFIITASFYLLFHYIEFTEEQVKAFAPVVFINSLIITLLLMVIDGIRRTLTINKKLREIENVLLRLTEGDYSARVSSINGYSNFDPLVKSINTLASELSSVENLREDFIANVSHELKTPLTVINNYSKMLKNPLVGEKERVEYATAINNTSSKLAVLITNILKLNKLENQQIFAKNEEFDLSEQLCVSLIDFENVWEEKGIEIETNIPDGIIVSADSELLSIVWNNLLSNAFKFTDNGGKVSVSLKQNDEYATVKISDTGCGMDNETGNHIFEKFYQGDTSRATLGNGLGLALVKKVVDIVHGEIEVESILSKGSTFTVRLKKRG